MHHKRPLGLSTPTDTVVRRKRRGHRRDRRLMACCREGGLYVGGYENGPGLAASAGPLWPENTALVRATDRPTLVLLAHPQCTCTRASLDRARRSCSRARRHAAEDLRPLPEARGFADGWEQTDLWRRGRGPARRHRRARRRRREGRAVRRRDVGPDLLYDARGALRLQRRHHRRARATPATTPDAARRSIALLNGTGDAGDARATSVFGCSALRSTGRARTRTLVRDIDHRAPRRASCSRSTSRTSTGAPIGCSPA